MRTSLFAAIAGSTLFVGMVSAQTELYEFKSEGVLKSYGGKSSPFDDINQDGFSDFVISPSWGGHIEIRSGKTGGVLTSTPALWAPREVDNYGDLDGDGVADVLAGADDWVRVFSGANGSLLLSVMNKGGYRARAVGDVDADGVLDAIAANENYPPLGHGPPPFQAHVISGQTAASIHSYVTPWDEAIGALVSSAGDIDFDGYDDFLLGNAPFGPAKHSVSIVSGKNGTVLMTNSIPEGRLRYLETIGDRDGDGTPDYVQALWHSPGGAGSSLNSIRFEFVSGASGGLLASTEAGATTDPYSLGHAEPAYLGDVDGDGIGDVGCGIPECSYSGTPIGPGRIEVYSGADGDLLFEVTGDEDNDCLGRSVSSVGDIDGDGRNEIVGGAEDLEIYGYTRVYASCAMTSAPSDGCIGSGSFAPRLRVTGCASVGSPVSLHVSDGLGSAPA